MLKSLQALFFLSFLIQKQHLFSDISNWEIKPEDPHGTEMFIVVRGLLLGMFPAAEPHGLLRDR